MKAKQVYLFVFRPQHSYVSVFALKMFALLIQVEHVYDWFSHQYLMGFTQVDATSHIDLSITCIKLVCSKLRIILLVKYYILLLLHS